MSDEKTGNLSRTIATWVGIVGSLIGIFFAISSYRDDIAERSKMHNKELAAASEADQKRADEHVKAAFEMIEAFHRPDMVTIRTHLIAGAEYANRTCLPLHGGASPLSTQEFFTLVEFFDRAQYCVDAGLCSPEVMAQLLASYANFWWPGAKKEILVARREEQSFKTAKPVGYGLETLATTPQPPASNPKCPR